MKAIILTTKLFGPGGVERFGRQISKTAWQILRSTGIKLQMISLVDDPQDIAAYPLNEQVIINSFNGSKFRFALYSFWRILNGASFVYVFHLHLAPIVFFVSLVRKSLKYGVHLHGIEAWQKISFLRKLSLERAEIITTSSKFTAQRACEINYLDETKTKVLYPAYNHIRFDKREMGDLDKNRNKIDQKKFILSVARLDKVDRGKGITDVLEALPYVLDKYPGINYIIVGSGDDLPRLKELARKLNISENVIFTGRVTDFDLAYFYAHCEAFIMPSSKEGLGIVFLEAMAFSKPVIACACGGSREVVVNGETGFLVTYGDIKEIQSALIKIVSNPVDAVKMGNAGRNLLENNFNQDKLQKDLREVFACLLANNLLN